MAIIIKKSERKPFEQPDAGLFLGTIIDVVDLEFVETTFNGIKKMQEKIRVIWVLDKNDSQNRPFRVMRDMNKNINFNPKTGKKSILYELIEQVTLQPPTDEFDAESLIGYSNQLFLVKETNAATNKTYTNIKGIAPLSNGQTGPKVPSDFVRAKDKTATGTAQTTQSQTSNDSATQLASNDVEL